MLLPRFEFHQPAGLAEALGLLADFGGEAKILAGGTDLLVHLKHKRLKPAHLVSLEAVGGLSEVSANGEVTVGARTTIARLMEDPVVREHGGVLAQAAGNLGSPLIRNRATLGGNLASARPAADTAPPLMALRARVVLKSRSGEREVPLDEFFQGPGQSVLRPDEILTGVRFPKPPAGSGGGYQKLGLRKSMEIGLVNSAVQLTLDDDGRTIRAARVVLGSVAPTPIRSLQAEEALIGAPATQKTLVRAARAAVGDSCAITDFRATIDYRCQMVEVLTRRALETAIRRAAGDRSRS